MDDHDSDLRAHLGRLLDWEAAHAGFDAAVKGIGPALRGVAPKGHSHLPWQILEHLRLTRSTSSRRLACRSWTQGSR